MKPPRSLYAPPAIIRGAMHHGCVAGANEGGRGAAGWWPTSPSSRWAGRPTTPASGPPTTRRTYPATASPQAAGTAPAPPAWGCRAKHPWPGGVFVIDSKQHRGRLQLDPSGRLWHGRYPLTPMLRAVSFEADQAAQVLPDRAWRSGRLWPSTVLRSPGARSWRAVSRWCRPGACQACFVPSRRCWGPNGSPPWPTRPEAASALRLDSRHITLGDGYAPAAV